MREVLAIIFALLTLFIVLGTIGLLIDPKQAKDVALKRWHILCGGIVATLVSLTIFGIVAPPPSENAANEAAAKDNNSQAAANQVAVKPPAPVIPPATGMGNLEICLSKQDTDNGIKTFMIPLGAVFTSLGIAHGNILTDDVPYKSETDPKQVWNVEVLKPVTLTQAAPCAKTDTRLVIVKGMNGLDDNIIAEQHLFLGPYPLRIVNGAAHAYPEDIMRRKYENAYYKATGQASRRPQKYNPLLDEGLVAVAVGDIGNPHVVDEKSIYEMP